MGNPTSDASYEEAKKKAKEFYSKIGRIWCPKINDYIVFNQSGFRHLVRKRGVLRSKGDQMRRFALLIYARPIIQSPQAIISHERKFVENTETDFWIFTQIFDGIAVTLVTRRLGNGNIHFFSIYARKQKSASEGGFLTCPPSTL